jgi:galactonate dehydratase
MKIFDYELFTVPPRWVFLRLETDEGTVGWGEPAVEGRSETLCGVVSELIEDYVLGSDPTELTNLWYRMYRSNHYTNGAMVMSAIAGIDQALWDIKGKSLDMPVYRLLGGPVRDKVRIYRWLTGDNPNDLAEDATNAVDKGYSALGLMALTRPSQIRTREVVSRVNNRIKTVHDAVDDDIDIATDFRGRVSTSVARQLLSKLEQYDLMFVEEPVHPDHNSNLQEITSGINTPIATGQRMYSRWEFRPLLQSGIVDIVQPAIAHAGGISEVMRIGQMAEAYDVTMMPKCSVGPISFAAGMHVQMALPNAVLQEQHDEFYAGHNNQFFNYLQNDDYFSLADGFVTIEDTSGLGIRINEEHVRNQANKAADWKEPTWHYEDGGVANW